MTRPPTCITPATAAPSNNHLMDPLWVTHQRQRAGLYTNPRQPPPTPPNRLQQPQPARSRSSFTPTVQQQQLQRFNLLKQRIRQHHEQIQLPANAASKLAPEGEKAFPSQYSKDSTQSTSLSLMRGMQGYVFRLDVKTKLISIRAMESGQYSDLTIVCEDQKFSVHKVVVCTQSKVLAAAMKKGFKVMQKIYSRGMMLLRPPDCADILRSILGIRAESY